MTEPDSTTPPAAAQPEAEQEHDSTDWKSEARKWEQRAKENKAAASELEKARRASMTEAERAVTEAKQAGRSEALNEVGKRLARAEMRAAAASAGVEVDLDYLDLSHFLAEDGEPDVKAIGKYISKKAEARSAKEPDVPSFDGGARTTAPAGVDFNQMLRRAAGRD